MALVLSGKVGLPSAGRLICTPFTAGGLWRKLRHAAGILRTTRTRINGFEFWEEEERTSLVMRQEQRTRCPKEVQTVPPATVVSAVYHKGPTPLQKGVKVHRKCCERRASSPSIQEKLLPKCVTKWVRNQGDKRKRSVLRFFEMVVSELLKAARGELIYMEIIHGIQSWNEKL